VQTMDVSMADRGTTEARVPPSTPGTVVVATVVIEGEGQSFAVGSAQTAQGSHPKQLALQLPVNLSPTRYLATRVSGPLFDLVPHVS